MSLVQAELSTWARKARNSNWTAILNSYVKLFGTKCLTQKSDCLTEESRFSQDFIWKKSCVMGVRRRGKNLIADKGIC